MQKGRPKIEHAETVTLKKEWGGKTIKNVEEWPDEKRDHKLVKQFNDVDSVLHAVQLPGCGLVGVRPASCSCSR